MAIIDRSPRGELPGDGENDGRRNEGELVTDHPFEPKIAASFWSLCKECNLSEAAHSETTLKFEYWKDDYPDDE